MGHPEPMTYNDNEPTTLTDERAGYDAPSEAERLETWNHHAILYAWYHGQLSEGQAMKLLKVDRLAARELREKAESYNGWLMGKAVDPKAIEWAEERYHALALTVSNTRMQQDFKIEILADFAQDFAAQAVAAREAEIAAALEAKKKPLMDRLDWVNNSRNLVLDEAIDTIRKM